MLKDVFSYDNVVSYVNAREKQNHLGETLFPTRRVPGLEFEMLSGGNSLPTIAGVKAFDTESPIVGREARTQIAELALTSQKMHIKEQELIKLRNPRNEAERQYLQDQVFNDVMTTQEGVRATIEKMRMDVLSKGVVELGEGIQVDYGVPAEHQASAQIAKSTDVFSVFEGYADTLNVTPTRILTSKTVRNKILATDAVQNAFKDYGIVPTRANLNTLLEAYGLPTIVTYDEKYIDAEGNSQTYFPENKLVMFSDLQLGETIFGSTPEESRLLTSGELTTRANDVFSLIYETGLDPVATWVKSVATALPSFPQAENVFQLTVQGV